MQVFELAELAPISVRTMWVIVSLIGVTCLVVVVLLLGSCPPKFEVSAGGLNVRGGIFGRMIPASALQVGEGRIVDFSKSPGLRPKWRTMGTALPGYQAGWFRLHDGSKALVFLVKGKPVVFIPTTEGFSLLVSIADPDAFLTSLRADHQ